MKDQQLWLEIKRNLLWLTTFRATRDEEMGKKEGRAVKYAQFEIKTIGRMKSYPDQKELYYLLKELDYDPELKLVLEPAVKAEIS
jgi:hypothetical protein